MNKKMKGLFLIFKGIKFKEIDSYGDLMTIKDFISAVKSGNFIDYDGTGLYAFKDMQTKDIEVLPSDISKGKVDKRFTHVMWYNKWKLR